MGNERKRTGDDERYTKPFQRACFSTAACKMSSWSPEQYERFREERSQPFYDLMALVHRRPLMRVVDLGCGTGDLTGALHHELKARKTLGVDSSDTMLAKAAEVASEFAEALHGYQRQVPVLAPEAYAVLLDRLGFKKQRVRLEVYAHTLPSRESVIEWVKGTLLTDYRGWLDAPTYEKFLVRYRERLFERLPESMPFLYPFKRILMWAEK